MKERFEIINRLWNRHLEPLHDLIYVKKAMDAEFDALERSLVANCSTTEEIRNGRLIHNPLQIISLIVGRASDLYRLINTSPVSRDHSQQTLLQLSTTHQGDDENRL